MLRCVSRINHKLMIFYQLYRAQDISQIDIVMLCENVILSRSAQIAKLFDDMINIKEMPDIF